LRFVQRYAGARTEERAEELGVSVVQFVDGGYRRSIP
jgi:hypothetical protein